MYREILNEDLFIDFQIKLENYIQSNVIRDEANNIFIKQQLIIFKTNFPKKQNEILKLYNLWRLNDEHSAAIIELINLF